MNKYNVLYTADKNYIKYTAVSILSLLENNEDININIHLIGDKLTDKDNKLIESIVNNYKNAHVIFYDFKAIESIIKEYNIPSWHNSLIPNARLFFDEIIKDVDNILYLDSDTIITDSIKDIVKYNNTINMVQDTMPKNYWQRLDSDLKKYCNSGVIWINTKKWQSNNCHNKIIKTLEKTNNYEFPDQDIINIALKDEISLLPPNYNLFATDAYFPLTLLKRYYKINNIERYSNKELKDAIRYPIILHSTSFYDWKAWYDKCIHPYHNIYTKYLNDLGLEINKNDKYVPNELLYNIRLLASFYIPKDIKEKIKQKIK